MAVEQGIPFDYFPYGKLSFTSHKEYVVKLV